MTSSFLAKKKLLAWFKREAKSSFPQRPGPVQCPKRCPKCIAKTDDLKLIEASNDFTQIKCFDNLMIRKPFKSSQYQSVQYHVGQVDILKRVLELPDHVVIYVVATNNHIDVAILESLFDYANLDKFQIINKQNYVNCPNLTTKDRLALSVRLRSCPATCLNPTEDLNLKPRDVEAFFDSIIKKVRFENKNVVLIPICITKDHENSTLAGLNMGSICIQILEPFTIGSYIRNLTTISRSTHLTQHLYYDLSHDCVILATHLVAFIILYLERDKGVTRNDMLDYVKWFIRSSIDTNIQIGFTGQPDKVVEFALTVLKDYIHLTESKFYIARDYDKLMDYADLVTPIVAYQGLVSRAILMEYNRANPDKIMTSFSSRTRIKVNKDKVYEIVGELSELIERGVVCRKPCVTMEEKIFETCETMQTCGKYFIIEEPKNVPKTSRKRYNWAGDFDDSDDDAYFEQNRDNPLFQSHIVLTMNERKLDQLNLLMNSLESFLV